VNGLYLNLATQSVTTYGPTSSSGKGGASCSVSARNFVCHRLNTKEAHLEKIKFWTRLFQLTKIALEF